MRFTSDWVDKQVAEAEVVERKVREAAEYTSTAREYAGSGYRTGSGSSYERVEPEMVLACYDVDTLAEEVSDLKMTGITGVFVRLRAEKAEEGNVPAGKSAYNARKLLRYEELREQSESYLEQMREDMDVLQTYVEAGGEPGDVDSDWNRDRILDQVSDELRERYSAGELETMIDEMVED